MKLAKNTLRLVALALLLGGGGIWLAAGAHRGWTQTSVAVKTLEDVTGIEAIEYQRRFVPGLDFLGGVLLAAAGLAGASLFLRTQTKPTTNT
jgi:hypothetical protein